MTAFAPNKVQFTGLYEAIGDKQVRVTELPVGVWTDDFKAFLEAQIAGKKSSIRDYDDNSTDSDVDIMVHLSRPVEDVVKVLRLSTSKSTANMHLFDSDEKLKKYASVKEILDDFYRTRLRVYVDRKEHELRSMRTAMVRASNKVAYIQGVLDDSIDLRRKSSADIESSLAAAGLEKLEGSFAYLVKMPMDSVSEENVARLLSEHSELKHRIDGLDRMSPEDMWASDLDGLEKLM